MSPFLLTRIFFLLAKNCVVIATEVNVVAVAHVAVSQARSGLKP